MPASTPMRPDAGTYALLLRCDQTSRVQVGRWRELDLETGFYLYVGSAFGPGGVRARVQRHCCQPAAKHWHVDYLRIVTSVLGAWHAYEKRDLEHRWAQTLSVTPGASALPGFGCSDCECATHLFRLEKRPGGTQMSRLLEGRVAFWRVPGQGRPATGRWI